MTSSVFALGDVFALSAFSLAYATRAFYFALIDPCKIWSGQVRVPPVFNFLMVSNEHYIPYPKPAQAFFRKIRIFKLLWILAWPSHLYYKTEEFLGLLFAVPLSELVASLVEGLSYCRFFLMASAWSLVTSTPNFSAIFMCFIADSYFFSL